jgi:molybdopterin/thiamine biosynthesis adenylyltransferase
MNKKPLSITEPNIATTATIAVVGLGNIGSWLAALLVRMREIGRLILIDGDHYDASNLIGQDITPDAIGRAKVGAQAERLSSVRADDLAIVDIARRIENVPLGILARSDLIVAGVDSNGTRQNISEIAFRLGIPYLDCGVNPAHATARLSFYDPRHPDSACMECNWGPNDYARLDARKSCSEAATSKAPATTGNAFLGSLSASTAASAIHRFLQSDSGTCLDMDADTPARQTVIEAFSLNALRGGVKRNPHCHFDHKRLTRELVTDSDTDASLKTFLTHIGVDASTATLSIPGVSWIIEHRCEQCPDSKIRRPALFDRPLVDPPTCPDCGIPAAPFGFTGSDSLSCSDLLTAELESPLASFGIEPGDIIAVTNAGSGATRYIELRHETAPMRPEHAAA